VSRLHCHLVSRIPNDGQRPKNPVILRKETVRKKRHIEEALVKRRVRFRDNLELDKFKLNKFNILRVKRGHLNAAA
jgi:hypothetical protein